MDKKFNNVVVQENTYKKLKELGKFGDSFNSIILRLIEAGHQEVIIK
jgi:predicted CopG family antitoxin